EAIRRMAPGEFVCQVLRVEVGDSRLAGHWALPPAPYGSASRCEGGTVRHVQYRSPSGRVSRVATLYSIGHSNHSSERLLELLGEQQVAVVFDVRSAPYSRHHPQFDLPVLRDTLRSAGVRYEHAPALGG